MLDLSNDYVLYSLKSNCRCIDVNENRKGLNDGMKVIIVIKFNFLIKIKPLWFCTIKSEVIE